MRPLMLPLAALAMAAASSVPIHAQPADRAYVDGRELRGNERRLQNERRDLAEARFYGDRDDIRDERRDVKRARKEARQDARDWQRGRAYNYNRPDPRYNGYYADNYYRGDGNYQARPLGVNDRIYRGQDNRYYCRRNDGTTGLIIGALGGGVLGNVIAPGGSKTLGSIVGGGLGAVLGNSVGRNNVTCR